MMDWCRKHMGELAWACKNLSQDPDLADNQRQALGKLYALAKQWSSIPNAGGTANLATVVAMACNTCQQCEGRNDWREPCLLIYDNAQMYQ